MKTYIGKFNETQIKNGDDKKAIEKGMSETGMKYIKSDLVKKKGKIVAIEVYLSDTI